MKILYFDCSNGISGDMLLKALMNVGECQGEVIEAVESEEICQSERSSHYHNPHEHEHERCGEHHKHKHEHNGKSYTDVKRIIAESSFTTRAKECALNIYGHIAKAEATVHGETLDTIHFHEVGRDEAIKNALGIGMALEIINPDKIITSDIYDGRGTIICSHGEIPVPVPAVMALRKESSFTFREAPVKTEMVTPSGLAGLMGIGAEPGKMPEGDIIKETEAKGGRDTGRPGFRAYIISNDI